MALRPLGDRIIVKATDAEEKSAGGILLPDTAREKPTQGKVVSVGPGKLLDNGKTVPMEIKKDDVIYYAKYGGTEVKVGAEEHVILRQDDVLAVVEKESLRARPFLTSFLNGVKNPVPCSHSYRMLRKLKHDVKCDQSESFSISN